MMRSRFDEQLALLDQELIAMDSLCEQVIALASSALTEGSGGIAAKVAPVDREIDRKDREIMPPISQSGCGFPSPGPGKAEG